MSESTSAIADLPQPREDIFPPPSLDSSADSSVSSSLRDTPDRTLPRGCLARTTSAITTAISDPLASKGAVSVFDQAIVSGTSFATSVLIGRMCTKEELGVYYLALSIVFLVRGIQEQIICAPYMIYCNRRQGRRLASYSGSAVAHQLALSGLTLLGLLGMAVLIWLGLGPASLAPAVWVLLGAAPLMLMREFIRQFAFAHLRVGAAVAIDAVVAVLQLGSLLLLGWLGALSIVTVYLAIGGASAVACAGWFLAKKQPLRFVRSRFAVDWRHNWGFGKWALASHLVGSTSPYLMPWVLVMACGAAETGMLAACATLVGVSNMFLTGVANYLTPKAANAFATGGVDELRRVIWKTAALLAVALGSFCLVMVAAGNLLAVIVYGDGYAGAGPIMAVLAFAVLANGIGIAAGNGLWAMERPSANFRADVCSLVVTLAAAVLLVGPMGVLGVAVAELAGFTGGTLVRCVTLFRLMK